MRGISRQPGAGAGTRRIGRRRRAEAAARTPWYARQMALWSHVLCPVSERERAAALRGASWRLVPGNTCVRETRRLATRQVTGWELSGLADTVELLVSELVTNSVRHTPGPVRLTLQMHDGRLRCEVEDVAVSNPVRSTVDQDAEGGRGTELLDMLAGDWGCVPTESGKTVWFELDVLHAD
ncbi:ATP-binding protein [Streptomyces sp. NPDC091879]|uniref:ATP-binding protein n=1 Tax=Streptomyces sp. NPDC091879 TaxID=3366006 RepID=UPI0038059856